MTDLARGARAVTDLIRGVNLDPTARAVRAFFKYHFGASFILIVAFQMLGALSDDLGGSFTFGHLVGSVMTMALLILMFPLTLVVNGVWQWGDLSDSTTVSTYYTWVTYTDFLGGDCLRSG